VTSSPQISAVIATYNQGRYIGETLESVLRQTHPDFEIVVDDDGSTDRIALARDSIVAHRGA